MGNSLLRQTKRQLKSQSFQWQIVGVNAYCSRVLDIHTGILAQKYSVDLGLIESQWQTYVLRRNHVSHLVGIYDFIQPEQVSFCSSHRQAAVVVEYIPYRLSDLGTLSFQEGLCILKCVLEGYKILREQKIEFYLLDEANICFNQRGKCKFWINQNLFLSKPSSNRIVSEENFVKGLLEIIEPRMVELAAQYQQKRTRMTAFTLAKLLVLVRSQISQDSDKIVFLKSNSGLTEAEIRAIKCLTSNKSQEKGNGSKKVSISKNKQSNKKGDRKNELELKKFKSLQLHKLDGLTCAHTKLSLAWNAARRLSQLDHRKYPIDVYFSPRRQSEGRAMEKDDRGGLRKGGYYSPLFQTSYSCIQ